MSQSIDLNLIREDFLMLNVQTDNAAELNRALDKAKELWRLLNMKLPVGSFRRYEHSRHLFAVDLACRVMNLTLDRSKLHAVLSIADGEYNQLIRQSKTALDLQFKSVDLFAKLSVKYDASLVDAAKEKLNFYKINYFDRLPAASRDYIDIGDSLHAAAVFLLTAAEIKVKVNKTEITRLAEASAPELQRKISHMQQVIDQNHYESETKSGGQMRSLPTRTAIPIVANKRASLIKRLASNVQHKTLQQQHQLHQQNAKGNEDLLQKFDDASKIIAGNVGGKRSLPPEASAVARNEEHSLKQHKGSTIEVSKMQRVSSVEGALSNAHEQVSARDPASAVSDEVNLQIEKRRAYEEWRKNMLKAKAERSKLTDVRSSAQINENSD